MSWIVIQGVTLTIKNTPQVKHNICGVKNALPIILSSLKQNLVWLLKNFLSSKY